MHSDRLREMANAAALGMILGVILFALAACASIGPRLVAPRVTIESISIGRVERGDAIVNLSLRLENPNEIGLSLQSLRFALSINDIALVNGATLRSETVPAGGSAVIEIETRTSINAVLQLMALSAGRRAPALHYALDGEAIVQNGIRLPLVKSGEIPLSPPPGSPQ
jgi:LEA14-like dessication related protein